MDDRTCTHCGRQLTGRADQRYCSARCRVAANRAAKQPERPKRPRPPLPPTARNRVMDVFTAMGRLLDVTRDDRYPRIREEMDPQIRNSMLFVIRMGAKSLRDLAGDDAPESLIDEAKIYKPKAPKGRRKALDAQLIQASNVSSLRDHLILTQGSDGPVDDMTELLREIDRAIVGLVDAREWITRNK